MEDVTGASAMQLAPTGPGDLVAQLNEAAKRPRLARWAAVAAFVLLFVKPPIGTVIGLVSIPGVVWLFLWERGRRSIVAFYDVNDEFADWFQRLVDRFEQAKGMARAWRVTTAGQVRTTQQYKVNSGANSLVSRGAASMTLTGPKLLKTNIIVPTVSAGRQTLHFLPDRVLVSDGKRFSDVSYSALDVGSGSERFIEAEGKPRDSTLVDTTWQYVNVKGGPDRRYKNNRQLPILLYGTLELSSQAGLHWQLQGSQSTGFVPLAEVLRQAPSAPVADGSISPVELHNGYQSSVLINSLAGHGSEHGSAEEAAQAAGEEASQDSDVATTVPRTADEREAVLSERGALWEYRLLVAYLLEGKERLEPKWRDLQIGYTSARGRVLDRADAIEAFGNAFSEGSALIGNLMQLFTSTALEPAIGKDGSPGDPTLIEHWANRFIEVYEEFLNWPAQLRAMKVPDALKPLFETASRFLDIPIEETRAFIDKAVADLDGLEARLRAGEEPTLVFALQLKPDPTLQRELEERLAAAQS